jgi:hypothetical protein
MKISWTGSKERSRIPTLWGESLGFCAIMVQSMFPRMYPRSSIRRTCVMVTAQGSLCDWQTATAVGVDSSFMHWKNKMICAEFKEVLLLLTERYRSVLLSILYQCLETAGLLNTNNSKGTSGEVSWWTCAIEILLIQILQNFKIIVTEISNWHQGGTKLPEIWFRPPLPISGRHKAPKMASVMVCSRTSPVVSKMYGYFSFKVN